MDMIRLEITGYQELLAKLEAIRRPRPIKLALKRGAQNMQHWVQSKRLSGPRPEFLGVITNRLRSSITTSDVDEIPGGYEVRIGTDVKYARIHEFGGVTKPHKIFPKHGKVLAWAMGSKMHMKSGALVMNKRGKGANIYAYAKSVNHPGSRIPARPYLRPAIQEQENITYIENELKRQIEQEIDRA